MKLLVITQIVDETDSNLGFFHNWLKKTAGKIDHVYVICLKKGIHSLPDNVTILSLGKEQSVSRFEYVRRFYKYIWQYRNNYDNVWVHMNPEYVVLGGLLWKIWHKKVLLWYMHKTVDFKLRVAEKLVTGIFTASTESFRLKSNKVNIVGHGIDLAEFESHMRPRIGKISLATVGRITRSKDLKTLIEGVAEFKKIANQPIVFTIAGAPITRDDEAYFLELKSAIKKLDIETEVIFLGAVNHAQLSKTYHDAHIFLHASQTGSMDKVVLEALANGRPVISSSEAFVGQQYEQFIFRFMQGNAVDLARTIENVYKSGIVDPEKLPNKQAIDYVKNNHNLDNLLAKIIEYFTV